MPREIQSRGYGKRVGRSNTPRPRPPRRPPQPQRRRIVAKRNAPAPRIQLPGLASGPVFTKRERARLRSGRTVPAGGRKVYVRDAGGSLRTLDRSQYRRVVKRTARDVAARRQEARRQGYRDVSAYAKANQAKPGTAHRFQVAGITGGELRRFASRKTLIGAAGPGFYELGSRAATGALRDAIGLPENTVVGAYHTGSALVKAAKGDTSELKALGKSLKNTDPIALAVQGRFHEAAVQAGQHPLLAALEVYGTGASVSRGVGRLSGAAGGERLALRVPGTNIVQVRRYPKGVVGKGLVKGREQIAEARQRRLTRKAEVAERADPGGDEARALRQSAAAVDPHRVSERHIEHQVDLLEGLGQSMRRPGRSETAKASRDALGGRRPPGGVGLSLTAQGITKASREDLGRYLNELHAEAQGGKLSRPKLAANKRLRRGLANTLNDRKMVDASEVQKAAEDYAKVTGPLEREMIGAKMLNPEEAEKAKLIPYAARRMGAKQVQGIGIVRGSQVKAAERIRKEIAAVHRSPDLTPNEKRHQVRELQRRGSLLVLRSPTIRGHMRANGVNPDHISFVTQAPNRLGDRSFNVSSRRPQGIPTKARSGEAVRQGALDPRAERLVEQAVQMRGLADANRHWKRFVNTMGLRRPDGSLYTEGTKGAAEAKRDSLMYDEHGNPLPGAHQWRVIRLTPWAQRQEQLTKLLEGADEEGFVSVNGTRRHPVSESIDSALRGEDGEGPWGVVPEVAARRLEEHAAVVRTTGPVARAVTQAFRKTVLPFSPSWLVGNTVEGALRSAVARAGPTSWLTFRRTYNQLAVGDSSVLRALRRLPDARRGSPEEQLLHMIPGGHYGGVADTLIHQSAKSFENTRLRGLANTLSSLARKPGPKQVAGAFRAYTDWMFGTFNAGIEAQFTRALAGKHIRTGLMDKRHRENAETAIEQAARGITNTPEQVQMADFIRRAYGQYDSYPPAVRKWLLTYTPFGAWTFNAAKFVMSVLPKDHPGLTAMLAANHQLTEEWRMQQGLDQAAASPLPPFLRGSIPLPGGGHLRVARYTPFGLFSSPLETVASNVLPQFSGPLMTFRGLDWKGSPIRGKDGKQETDPLKLAAIAAREFAFATVPGIGMGSRIAQKGPSALNPLNPVAPRKDSKAKKDPIDAELDNIDKQLQGGDIDKELNRIDKELGVR